MQDTSDAETERLPRNSSSESPTSETLGPNSEIGSPPKSPNVEGLPLPPQPEASQPVAEPTLEALPSRTDLNVKSEVISDSPDPSTPGTASPPGSPQSQPPPRLLPIQAPCPKSRSPSPANRSPDFPDDVLAARLKAAIPAARAASRAVRPKLDPYQLIDPSVSDAPLPVGRVPRNLRPPPKKPAWTANPPPPPILPPKKAPPRIVPPPQRPPVRKVQIVQPKRFPGPRPPLNPDI